MVQLDETAEYTAWKQGNAARIDAERERLELAIADAESALELARDALAAFDADTG